MLSELKLAGNGQMVHEYVDLELSRSCSEFYADKTDQSRPLKGLEPWTYLTR